MNTTILLSIGIAAGIVGLIFIIQKISGGKTILLIAHRLTTLQECDTIFLLNEGKLIDQGNFQYLMESNLTFRQMARKESEKNILESQKIS